MKSKSTGYALILLIQFVEPWNTRCVGDFRISRFLRDRRRQRRLLLDAPTSSNTTTTTTQASTIIDHHFLQVALQEARQAAREGEVPIGAVVVDTTRNVVVARQHNRVEQRRDASAHAELLALRQAAKQTGNWRLYNTTLYSTLEPCVMCCAAAQAFRVGRIVYGAMDHRLGAIVSHVQLLNVTHPYHSIDDVEGGVCSDECGAVVRDFFRERRRQRRGKPANKGATTRWLTRVFRKRKAKI